MTGLADLISRYRVSENPLKAERRIELAALVLLLLLGLQVALGVLSIVASSSVPAILPSQDVLNVGKLEQIAQADADARNQVVSRPLFWLGRRSVTAAEVVVVEPAPEKAAGQKIKGVKLVGTYGGGAIIRLKNDKRRVAVGDEVEGWLLDAVEPNSARFVRGAAVDELMLQRVDASKLVKMVPSAPEQKPPAAEEKPEQERTLSVGGTR